MVEWGVREAFITHNTGAGPYDGKDYYTCPLKPKGLDGLTCGEVCSLLIAEWKSAPNSLGSGVCSALVSLKMGTPGPSKGKPEDVEAFIQQYYR